MYYFRCQEQVVERGPACELLTLTWKIDLKEVLQVRPTRVFRTQYACLGLCAQVGLSITISLRNTLASYDCRYHSSNLFPKRT